MLSRADAVLDHSTALLQAHFRRRAEASIADDEAELPAFMSGSLVTRGSLPSEPVPATVEEAIRFYYDALAKPGRGYLAAGRLIVEDRPSFAVYTTTRGDDGYVELFDHDGTPLTAARTFLELLEVSDTKDVRAQATLENAGRLPPSPKARRGETLAARAKAVKLARSSRKPHRRTSARADERDRSGDVRRRSARRARRGRRHSRQRTRSARRRQRGDRAVSTAAHARLITRPAWRRAGFGSSRRACRRSSGADSRSCARRPGVRARCDRW